MLKMQPILRGSPFQTRFVQSCVRNSNPERFAFFMLSRFSSSDTGFQAVLV